MNFLANIVLYLHKRYRHSKKRVWQFLKKLRMHQPCNPASASLNIRPREKSLIHTDTCVYSRSVHSRPKLETTRTCLSRWMGTRGHAHHRWDSAMQRNKLWYTEHPGRPPGEWYAWKKSQSPKVTYYVVPLTLRPWNEQTGGQAGGCQGSGAALEARKGFG